ncbi:hypothetical protein Prudu_012530 [Prunus dulcis]|uniref:DM2 domain-containing protein n=1 Tax=Prunus dulcis TaxID=3755 RepID=A0A4Y1RDF5_PRUDU|nr:hypothetical protein Prudu_012530 [Prunus dulcis]
MVTRAHRVRTIPFHRPNQSIWQSAATELDSCNCTGITIRNGMPNWVQVPFIELPSFYLPGSVDQNDKQMEQWNVRPPPLYLWSRPDWSAENKAIARELGHISASPPGFHENIAKATSPHHFPNSRRFHHNIPKFTNNF